MVSTTIWSWSCFHRQNIASPSPAYNYIVYLNSSSDDVHVYTRLFVKMCVSNGQVVDYREIHELICFIYDSYSKFSNDIWFCFISYFCVPITYNHQHVLFPCVINFFLDTLIRLNFICFRLCFWSIDWNNGFPNRFSLNSDWYYSVQTCTVTSNFLWYIWPQY